MPIGLPRFYFILINMKIPKYQVAIVYSGYLFTPNFGTSFVVGDVASVLKKGERYLIFAHFCLASLANIMDSVHVLIVAF